jgi:hypothetical protein
MACHQDTRKCYILIANESLENVTKLKCFGKTVIDQNYIYRDVKSRLTSGKACYISVQNLLTCLISKNFRIKI